MPAPAFCPLKVPTARPMAKDRQKNSTCRKEKLSDAKTVTDYPPDYEKSADDCADKWEEA